MDFLIIKKAEHAQAASIHRKMKILQILPELNSGGVERGTLELAAYLVSQGHEAIVVSNGGRQVAELEKSGARHISMPVHRKNLFSLLQVKPFRELLHREKPDILHIRSRVPGWIAYLAWRKIDKATRPRLVSTVHGFYSVSFYSEIMTKGERVIAVSQSIAEYIRTKYPKTSEDKITVIHRGIDPQIYPPNFTPDADWIKRWQSEHPDLLDKQIFLLPGRITRLKGHIDFFDLIDRLRSEGRPVHGLVVGDAHLKKKEYLQELQQILSEKKLSSEISFLGHRSDVREIMAISSVVCALSQQPESFGRTVLEALALGRPVLAYDCGGVGELLSTLFPQGKVPVGNHEILLKIARNILDHNPAPLLPKGSFTLEAMRKNTLSLYEELKHSPFS